MGRADASSAQIDGPNGISTPLHVSAYSGEPFKSKRPRNLLSKDRCRSALADEVEPNRPHVPTVKFSALLSTERKRLARTTSCPNRSVIGPAGESQGVGPAADSGEEVTLLGSAVLGLDFGDASFIDFPLRQVSGADQFPQPSRALRIVVVVPIHPPLIRKMRGRPP
jgi:hypothetical protein